MCSNAGARLTRRSGGESEGVRVSGGELHRDVLALDDRVGIRAGRELREQLARAIVDQRLGPGAADRAAAEPRVLLAPETKLRLDDQQVKTGVGY
jgi:hypothetical protein